MYITQTILHNFTAQKTWLQFRLFFGNLGKVVCVHYKYSFFFLLFFYFITKLWCNGTDLWTCSCCNVTNLQEPRFRFWVGEGPLVHIANNTAGIWKVNYKYTEELHFFHSKLYTKLYFLCIVTFAIMIDKILLHMTRKYTLFKWNKIKNTVL